MAIYDKASLVLIPSGTKTSKVYSQKPTNGDGDFTFSRSTAATRVNASGNIEKETGNLLLQSNQFDTTWTLDAGMTLTSGQSGYDGTSNAWLLDKPATNFREMKQSVTYSGVSTYSIYAKSGSLTAMTLRFVDGVANHYARFDLSSGSPISSTGNVIDMVMTDVGGGWYRCSTTIGSITGNQVYVYPDIEYNQAAGYIYIQDAQLEQGLVARDYIETTTTAIYGGITDNVPRLDYQGSCPALLLEPQRTNGITQSEYSGVYSTQGIVSMTDNFANSPEGYNNAFRVIPTTSNVQHLFFRSGMGNAALTYTQSIFAKANGYNFCFIRFDLPTRYAFFDLQNGTTAYTDSEITSTITDMGNGWYRCTATMTTTQYANAVIGVAEAGDSQADKDFAGDGTSSVLFYGHQSELGSYATSYIPTYGSAVTRNGESCIKTGISSLIGQTEGTLFLEAKSFANVYPTNTYTAITNSTGSNRILVGIAAQSNELRIVGVFGGVSNGGNNYTISDTTNYFKVAVKYYGSTLDVFINGEKKTSQSFGGYSNLVDAVRFDDGNGALPFEGDVKQRLIFPTALTDQEMIDLTTI
jgi:hypothetical protein